MVVSVLTRIECHWCVVPFTEGKGERRGEEEISILAEVKRSCLMCVSMCVKEQM